MPAIRKPDAIHIGLVADEPIRLAGLTSIFDLPAREGDFQLIPVAGSAPELILNAPIKYLVIDLHSSSVCLEVLDKISQARPDIGLIVIGPDGDDDLIVNAVIAGARAYLDFKASPKLVRKALDVVAEGYIWAPRRVLSRLVDRLLKAPAPPTITVAPKLTAREQQVMQLILLARSNREIAAHLGIEERTVKSHVARLMRKAGADNRIKLSMIALGGPLSPQGQAADGVRMGGADGALLE